MAMPSEVDTTIGRHADDVEKEDEVSEVQEKGSDEEKCNSEIVTMNDRTFPMPLENEKDPSGEEQTALSLSRTVSNACSRVTSRLTTRHIVDPGPPPDGGLRAWTQVAMAWITYVTTWGYLNSFGVFQTYYTSALNEVPSTVSWVGSVQLWMVFWMSAFSGRALDAGLFIPCFILGASLQIIGIFTNSVCHNFWQLLLAQGICTGLGGGIIACPTLGLVTTYFTKRRGIAVAIVTTGNSFGGMIYPLMVRELLPRIGFGWTVRVIGFINLACFAIVLTFIRPRLPPRKAGPLVEWRAFTELPYLLAIAGFTLAFGAMFFTYYYISSFGRTVLKMSYTDSANLLIIFNGIGIPARLLTGWAADRFTGPLNGVIPLMALNGLLAFIWISVTTVGGLYAETCVYGLAAGAFQCLFPTTVTSLNRDLSKNGVRLGMAFTVFSLAGLTGPPIGGAIITSGGGGRAGFIHALLGVGTATAVGVGLLCGARICKVGWKFRIKC